MLSLSSVLNNTCQGGLENGVRVRWLGERDVTWPLGTTGSPVTFTPVDSRGRLEPPTDDCKLMWIKCQPQKWLWPLSHLEFHQLGSMWGEGGKKEAMGKRSSFAVGGNRFVNCPRQSKWTFNHLCFSADNTFDIDLTCHFALEGRGEG